MTHLAFWQIKTIQGRMWDHRQPKSPTSNCTSQRSSMQRLGFVRTPSKTVNNRKLTVARAKARINLTRGSGATRAVQKQINYQHVWRATSNFFRQQPQSRATVSGLSSLLPSLRRTRAVQPTRCAPLPPSTTMKCWALLGLRFSPLWASPAFMHTHSAPIACRPWRRPPLPRKHRALTRSIIFQPRACMTETHSRGHRQCHRPWF